MGPNAGTGMGAMDSMGAQMQGHGSNHPPATEYTLQGVMRFLQTEWHRHERDRNAWEIEKQEMKGRIANLEGQARRADATQKALRKYVSILERKVKQQAELKGSEATDAAEPEKNDRAAKIQEKLKCEIYCQLLGPQLTSHPQPRPRRTQSLASMASSWKSPTTPRGTTLRPSSTSANPSSCT